MNSAKTILLAEHDAFLINVYASELRKSGYKTSVVSDEKIVLNRAKTIKPDLMILDASLQKSDGVPLLKSLRNDILLKDLKVVMLHNTNLPSGPVGHAEKFFRFGVEKHFSKAENTAEEIVNEVKRILS